MIKCLKDPMGICEWHNCLFESHMCSQSKQAGCCKIAVLILVIRLAACKRNRRSEICDLGACVRAWQLLTLHLHVSVWYGLQPFDWTPTTRTPDAGAFAREVSSATLVWLQFAEGGPRSTNDPYQRLTTSDGTRQAFFLQDVL